MENKVKLTLGLSVVDARAILNILGAQVDTYDKKRKEAKAQCKRKAKERLAKKKR